MIRSSRLKNNIHPELLDDRIKNLQSKKIFTVFDFLQEDPVKLTRYTDMTFQQVLDVKKEITKLYGGKVTKGVEMRPGQIEPTGIKSLDELLIGGLRSGEIYEICGLSACGKSQLCHTIAVNFIQRSGECVHYVDTKRDFSGSRTHSILESKQCSNEDRARVMDLLKVSRVGNVQELFNVLHHMKSVNADMEKLRAKLVIIDSLPAIFFQATKRTARSNHMHSLNHLANITRFLASRFGIIFVMVNLVTQWREEDGFDTIETNNAQIMKPALGKYWSYIPHTRLLLEVVEAEIVKITTWNSSEIPLGSTCRVEITNAGIV